MAEEVAQETFVRVWRSWDRIREPASAAAYLRATVVIPYGQREDAG